MSRALNNLSSARLNERQTTMFTPHIITKLKAALVAALIVVCFPTASVFAWNGNYLIVDGNGDYAQFLAEGPLEVGENNSKSFTVEFWVMPTKYGAIISDDAYDIGYVYDASTGRDVIQFRLWFDGENSGVLKRPIDLLGSGWHHVVCSYDNTLNKAAIGVDGDIDWLSNVIDDDGLFNGTSPFLIGSFRPSSGFFTGGIDEVRISDRIRYAGNSYTLPAAPFGGDANTLALWHFDDAPGATIFADSSINGNDLAAVGDAVTGSSTSGVISETLFLRDGGSLMEEIGPGVPWVEWLVWPTNPKSRQWETILTGDIAGSFSYQIDITQCSADTTLQIEFLVDRGSGEITVAADNVSLGPLNPGYYSPLTGNLEGLDITTSAGDKLILRISHMTGTSPVAVGFDGRDFWNDSRVTIYYPGLDACFAVSPESGSLDTLFSVNAGCTTDDTYNSSQIEVHWDWENDGAFDTGLTTTKSASHRFSSSGIKSIKLEAQNPDGLKKSQIKTVAIPAIIVDSFPAPEAAPAGLAWDANSGSLWLSDLYADQIYKMTPDGDIVGTPIPSPCDLPFDLAWDGSYLWALCAAGSGSPGHQLYRLNTAGTVISGPIDLPADYSHGLTWDGHFLWVADATQGRIAKINPANNGEVLLSFKSPGPDPRGLAWDGHFLWLADFYQNRIYQLDVKGTVINTWPSPASGPMGLTWDGTYLWCVDLDTYQVYRLADESLSLNSSISCDLSRTNLTLGELLTISGQISPSPGEAGKGISIELIPATGETVYRATLANIDGSFEYALDCSAIPKAGNWTVRTSWSGAGQYAGATSASQTLQVAKAGARVTLDVSSQAVHPNDKISFSGKFTPEPSCGGDLSGIPITLSINGPGGSEKIEITTNDQWGHYLITDYNNLNSPGTWTVQALFAGNDAYASSASEQLTVNVIESAGYAIIVQGKINSEEGLDAHNKTTMFVYDTLLARGFRDEDIRYFNYDRSQPGVDDIPTKSAIQTAITQWAGDRMNAKPANLYIIMVDHGLGDVFYIHPQLIAAVELSAWLDALQAGLTPQAVAQEIVTILGFCRSGSFIDNLSGPQRVVISSAAPGESSYKGPVDLDGIRDGEYFISQFFQQAALGKTIKECFDSAKQATEIYTASGSGDHQNAPFFDGSMQHPLLDDNSDGSGSNQLSGQTDDDGALSKTLFIGVGAASVNAAGNVSITEVVEPQFLQIGQDSVRLLWAAVDDHSRLRSIWVELKPPGYIPVDTQGSGQAEMNFTKTFGIFNQRSRHYEWADLAGFSTPGLYQILFFAKDDLSGDISSLMTTTVYKQKSGNSAPYAFNSIAPGDGSVELTSIVLDWEDTTDPDGDKITYRALLSKSDDSFSNPIRKEGIVSSTCLVTEEDGLQDLSIYYWKVQAVDGYGAIRETGVKILHTDNTNAIAGWLHGHVYDSSTGQPITNAVVQVGSTMLNTAANGYYLGMLQPGNYLLTASATGFQSVQKPDINLPDGGITSKDFALSPIGVDTDGDGILNSVENASGCLDPLDVDTDDDGIADGVEDKNLNGFIDPAETDPCDSDSDGDGIQDGTETGITTPIPDPDGGGPLQGTDAGKFVPDADPLTTTNPLMEDTDFDGSADGQEDRNCNGRMDAGERNPNFYQIGSGFVPSIILLLSE